MLAVATTPAKSVIRESNPPAGIVFPATLIPPPNPHVLNVIVSAEVSAKVIVATLWGVLRVPVLGNEDVWPSAISGARQTAKGNSVDLPPLDQDVFAPSYSALLNSAIR